MSDTPLLDALEAGPWPSMITEMKEQARKRTMEDVYDGILEDWTIVGECVWGTLYYDSKGRFEDGSLIQTTKMVEGGLFEGGTITTRNSTYRLGVQLVD